LTKQETVFDNRCTVTMEITAKNKDLDHKIRILRSRDEFQKHFEDALGGGYNVTVNRVNWQPARDRPCKYLSRSRGASVPYGNGSARLPDEEECTHPDLDVIDWEKVASCDDCPHYVPDPDFDPNDGGECP